MRSPCTATKSSPRLPQLEKARARQQRLNTAKNKKINKFIKKKKSPPSHFLMTCPRIMLLDLLMPQFPPPAKEATKSTYYLQSVILRME